MHADETTMRIDRQMDEDYGPALLRYAVKELVRRRTERGLGITDLATKTGLDSTEIVAFERNPIDSPVRTFDKYAEAVGLHVYASFCPWSLPQGTAEHLRELRADAINNGPSSTQAQLFRGFVYLLTENRWTLKAIGDVLGVTKQCVAKWLQGKRLFSDDWVIPDLPERPLIKKTLGPPSPTPYETRRMVHLQSLATNLRAHPDGHPFRVAAEELVELMHELDVRGVSLTDMGAVLGVSRSAVRARLMAYGFKEHSEKEVRLLNRTHPRKSQTTPPDPG